MLRFLPSIVVAAVLCVALVYADWVQQKNLTRDYQSEVEAQLQKTQLAYSSAISTFMRQGVNAFGVATATREFEQQDLVNLAGRVTSGGGRIVRAEYAPGYVTRAVTPLEGNEHRIGNPPTLKVGDPEDEPKVIAQRVFPTVRRVRLIGNDASEITAVVSLFQKEANGIAVNGLTVFVARFDLKLPDASATAGAGLEYYFDWLPGRGPRKELPPDWQKDSDLMPVGGKIEVPGGAFVLFARPIDGWAPSSGVMLNYRLKLGGLGFPVFILALLANWFSFTKRSTHDLLTKTEERMSGVLKNLSGAALTYTMPSGHSVPSAKDRIDFLNKLACEELWGYEAKAVRADSRILWGYGDDPKAIEDISRVLIESATALSPLQHVWSINKRQGETKWLDGRGYPTRLKDGSVRWAIIIFDATQRIEHEQELEHQRELAFRAQKNESIGHLTGGIAHDFNNLLAVIMGSLELLQDDETDPERHSLIRAAIGASLRGADLTKSMLSFARKARLAPEILDINDIVRESHDWIARTLPETVAHQTVLSAGLWKVSADRSSTESALLNLILNARDAMEGRGTLKVETANLQVDAAGLDIQQDTLPPGRYVVLSVSDTGYGIPENIRNQIFEPFFSTKAPGKGTGLGLSMVMGFMQQSGGSAQALSSLGESTTIKLIFPAAETSTGNIRSLAGDWVPKHGEGQKILVVEDEEAVCEIIKISLELSGYHVTVAATGDEASSIFTAQPDFDLLLTDVVMPGVMQGPDLAKSLREQNPDLPVILMTGYASDAAMIGKGPRSGDICLTKPVTRNELLKAVAQALGGASVAD